MPMGLLAKLCALLMGILSGAASTFGVRSKITRASYFSVAGASCRTTVHTL